MAYSVIYASGDGVTDTFAISYPLGFISRADVICRVGSEVNALGNPVYRTLTWITDGLVKVNGPVPPVGTDNIAFYRTVSKTELVHDYSDGSPITESNLDDSNKQVLMAVQEFLDGRGEFGIGIQDAVQQAVDAAGAAAVSAQEAQDAADSLVLPDFGDLAVLDTVSSDQIATGAVNTGHIVDSAVTTSKLLNGAVTSAKLDSAGVALPNGSTATTQSVGDNSTKAATTAYADSAGVGGTSQTWQNLTASRAFNTSYTNNTGRPISFFVQGTQVASGYMSVVIGGVTLGGPAPSNIGEISIVTATVPNGTTYRVNAVQTLNVWAELR